jgi:dihydropteroate synthase
MMKLRCGTRTLDCSTPRIMAVLNVTPDSFFDGGSCYQQGILQLDRALRRAEVLLKDGADILDVGGESTRPGAASVSSAEECDRVLPVVEALGRTFDTVISVDTSNPVVIREAARLGAGFINDVRALQQPEALAEVAASGLPVCLMHMQGSPQTMQDRPEYDDPVADVHAFLAYRRSLCLAAGIGAEQIVVDPGIGFGKTDEHNLELLRNLGRFTDLGVVLLGVSRKSLFGRLLGRELQDRLPGSLATGLIGCQKGARILRVHDVAATRDALRMWQLIDGEHNN